MDPSISRAPSSMPGIKCECISAPSQLRSIDAVFFLEKNILFLFLFEQFIIQPRHIGHKSLVAETIKNMLVTVSPHVSSQLIILNQSQKMLTEQVPLINICKQRRFSFYHNISDAANPC